MKVTRRELVCFVYGFFVCSFLVHIYSGYLAAERDLQDLELFLDEEADHDPAISEDNNAELNVRKIVYLHVGKSGGSTTKGALRIRCIANRWRNKQRSQCRNEMKKMFKATGGEGALSQQVIGYSHVDVSPSEAIWMRSNAFLFSVRNPINRFISWYDAIYDKMCRQKSKNGKCDYKFNEIHGEVGRGVFQCFSTGIESLAESLTASPLYPEQRLCWRRAWEIFRTRSSESPPWMWHVNPYNYQYYAEQSIHRFPNREVFAIRTEHLWDDFEQIDKILGGSGAGFQRKQINKGRRKLELSAASRTNLCCALIRELAYYEEILRRAANIDGNAYFSSMKTVLKDCGGPFKQRVGSLINSTSDGSYLQVWANVTGCIDAGLLSAVAV